MRGIDFTGIRERHGKMPGGLQNWKRAYMANSKKNSHAQLWAAAMNRVAVLGVWAVWQV
jgi:hypothetical protein